MGMFVSRLFCQAYQVLSDRILKVVSGSLQHQLPDIFTTSGTRPKLTFPRGLQAMTPFLPKCQWRPCNVVQNMNTVDFVQTAFLDNTHLKQWFLIPQLLVKLRFLYRLPKRDLYCNAYAIKDSFLGKLILVVIYPYVIF